MITIKISKNLDNLIDNVNLVSNVLLHQNRVNKFQEPPQMAFSISVRH